MNQKLKLENQTELWYLPGFELWRCQKERELNESVIIRHSNIHIWCVVYILRSIEYIEWIGGAYVWACVCVWECSFFFVFDCGVAPFWIPNYHKTMCLSLPYMPYANGGVFVVIVAVAVVVGLLDKSVSKSTVLTCRPAVEYNKCSTPNWYTNELWWWWWWWLICNWSPSDCRFLCILCQSIC